MATRRQEFFELAESDRRYAPEAYEFLCHALGYTQKTMAGVKTRGTKSGGVRHHVSGKQLLEGIRLFALDQFGRMAYIVFDRWGVHSTSDFGHMVFKMIDAGLWHKSESDRIEDFDNLYNFEHAFVRDFELSCEDQD